jgi:Putative zinc-finger
MNCESYRELLALQVFGELEKELEIDLKSHLADCEGCRQTNLEFSAISGLMRQIPERPWDEKLRIRDLLRHNQKLRTMVFSKAALWILAIAALLTVISFLPLHWELGDNHFAVSWGGEATRNADLAKELKSVQVQLSHIQNQGQDWQQTLEARIKEIVEQNNAAQQKQYWQTLEMFANYVQLQRKADLQKIQHEVASTYDRTGHEVQKTNELLEYVLRTSAPVDQQ